MPSNLWFLLIGLAMAGSTDDVRPVDDRVARFTEEQLEETLETIAHTERTLGDSEQLADNLGSLAAIAAGLGRENVRQGALTRELAIRTEVQGRDHPATVRTLRVLGSALCDVAPYGEGLALLQEAVALTKNRHGELHRETGVSLSHLAYGLGASGEYASAAEALESVVEIDEAVLGPDHIDVAATLSALARARIDLAEHAEAEEILGRALVIRETLVGPKDPLVASTLGALAAVQSSRGQLDAAVATWQRALDILVEAGAAPDEILSAKVGLAKDLLRLGQARRGLELVLEAHGEAEEVLDPGHPVRLWVLTVAGQAYGATGDRVAALEFLGRALEQQRARHGDRPHQEVASALSLIAEQHSLQGDLVQSLAAREESLAILQARYGEGHPKLLSPLGELARDLVSRGDVDGGTRRFVEAHEIATRRLGADSYQTAETAANLAGAHIAKGAFAEAEELLVEAVPILEQADTKQELLCKTHNRLGDVRNLQGEADAALASYQRGRECGESIGLDSPFALAALNAQGALHFEEGRPDEAAALFRLALEREGSDPAYYRRRLPLLHNLARVLAKESLQESLLLKQETFAGALQYLEDILPTVSEREGYGLLARHHYAIDDLAAVAVLKPDDAWKGLVRWKGLRARAGAQKRTRIAAAGDEHVLVQVEELAASRRELARLTYLPSRLRSATWSDDLVLLTAQKEEQERQLARSGLDSALPQVDGSQVCEALPPGSVLVDFLQRRDDGGRGGYVAFVVNPECQVQAVDLGDAGPIDQAILDYRALLATPDLSERIDDSGEVVHDFVWRPIESLLGGAQDVLIVPDGPLSTLSFAALPAGEEYLIERYSFRYLESAAALVVEPEPAGVDAVIVGDVDFDRIGADLAAPGHACQAQGFADLPRASRELEFVGRELRRHRRRERVHTFTRAAAREATLTGALPGKRLVHLATRGFFATDSCRSVQGERADSLAGERETIGLDPMVLSGLALAGANSPAIAGQGLWTAEEISSLDLRGVELVVLSACETGLGEVESGRGVLGLQRAFAQAGADNLIMSLWVVPGFDTERLMRNFYRNLLRGRGQTPSAALRQAQLALLAGNRADSGHARPQDWGAFIAGGL